MAVFVSCDADFRIIVQRLRCALQPLGGRDAIPKAHVTSLDIDPSQISGLSRDIYILAGFAFCALYYQALKNALSRE